MNASTSLRLLLGGKVGRDYLLGLCLEQFERSGSY